MKEIKGQFNTAKVFATTIEESCEKQILELCNEEWTKDSKIRIMADTHSGKGCVIGTTMTITDKIVPFLVGVDGSCGMFTTQFNTDGLDLAQVDRIIKGNIPMGRNHRKSCFDDNENQIKSLLKTSLFATETKITGKEIALQVGTLGGG